MQRYLKQQIESDLLRKMVFLGGPRQVGKTTLAKTFLNKSQGYLNWDIASQRELILKQKFPDAPIWVFDELHKYRLWRNYIKGVFDEFGETQKILVTGSARLDIYRYGGDSLQGRYYYLKLHPFSLKEIGGSHSDLQALLKFGGFPEPLLQASESRARRWSVEYRNRLIREDIASLESIKDLGSLERLILALPEKVGSPLSINSLREDLQLNHQTVSRWLDVFERTYAIFRLLPFVASGLRAVKKERKHYHYDWSLVDQPGPRFENMLASHLLKWCDYMFDTEGREIELKYYRDVDGREVDFVLVEKKKPLIFIECKLNDKQISKHLIYLKERFPNARALQVCLDLKADLKTKSGIEIKSARSFLNELV
jgi:predicted AAA+ superfamily ATPase